MNSWFNQIKFSIINKQIKSKMVEKKLLAKWNQAHNLQLFQFKWCCQQIGNSEQSGTPKAREFTHCQERQNIALKSRSFWSLSGKWSQDPRVLAEKFLHQAEWNHQYVAGIFRFDVQFRSQTTYWSATKILWENKTKSGIWLDVWNSCQSQQPWL